MRMQAQTSCILLNCRQAVNRAALAVQLGATDAPLSSIPIYAGQMAGKEGNTQAITVMQQCMTEQRYVRDSVTRSLIYNQVGPQATQVMLPPVKAWHHCLHPEGR